MNTNYKRDEKVYNWFFDMDSKLFRCKSYNIDYYMSMDGAQWSIIDEYILYTYELIKVFHFFTKQIKKQHRLPGMLISNNKILAKIKVLNLVVRSYGCYVEKPEFITDDNYDILLFAIDELKRLEYEYPELIIKSNDFINVTNCQSLIWR